MSCLYLGNSRAIIGNREFSMIHFVVSSLLSVKFVMICVSHYVGKCKTVLDFGFHAVDSGSQTINFGLLVIGTWIPDFLDSQVEDFQFHKNKFSDDSELHKQNFPDSGIRIILH